MLYSNRFLGEFDIKNNNLIIKSSSKNQSNKDMLYLFLIGRIIKVNDNNILNNQQNLIRSMFLNFGEKFIKKIDGYFLIIIFDKKDNSFYIFNNRYSNTYCYYYFSDDKIIFSDKITSILKKIKTKPKLNYDVIDVFLNSSYSFSNKTNFNKIYRMIPGFYLKVKNRKIFHIKYSQMDFDRKPVYDISKKLDEYEKIWTDTIKSYTQNNRTNNLACTLSGGTDTSWVVLMASKVFKKPINVYTCKFDYNLFDETKAAKSVAKKINAKYHEIHVDEKDLDLLPEMIRITEEPVLAASLPIFKLIKEASKKNDTLLTGDGGDNIYHDLYPVSEIHKYICFLPFVFRKLLFNVIDFISKNTNWNRVWELRYVLYAFSFKNIYDNFYKNLVCYRHFDKSQRKKLLKIKYYHEFQEKYNLGKISIKKASFDDDLIHARFVHGNMEYVSTFHDKLTKAYGMKFFPPYQSKGIMDFICSLPMDLLFKGNTFQKLTNKARKRCFVKQGLKRYLPKSSVPNKCVPFDQPYHAWLEKRPEVVKLLFRRLIKRGWYKEDFLNNLYEEHKKQKQHKKEYCHLSNHGYRIMLLLSLEIWCMEFIDNKNKKRNISLEEYLSI